MKVYDGARLAFQIGKIINPKGFKAEFERRKNLASQRPSFNNGQNNAEGNGSSPSTNPQMADLPISFPTLQLSPSDRESLMSLKASEIQEAMRKCSLDTYQNAHHISRIAFDGMPTVRMISTTLRADYNQKETYQLSEKQQELFEADTKLRLEERAEHLPKVSVSEVLYRITNNHLIGISYVPECDGYLRKAYTRAFAGSDKGKIVEDNEEIYSCIEGAVDVTLARVDRNYQESLMGQLSKIFARKNAGIAVLALATGLSVQEMNSPPVTSDNAASILQFEDRSI